MTPQWLPYFLAVWIILDVAQISLFSYRIHNLKDHKAEELAIARKVAYDHGFISARLSLPIVQHCNSRTNYEFIKHEWDPEKCKHCKEVQDILNEH